MKPAIQASERSEYGFTLLELIMVVSLISLIVASASPYLVNALDQARVTACQANLRIIDTVTTVDSIQNDKVPASIDELVSEGDLDKQPVEPFGGHYALKGSETECSEGHTY